MNKSNINMERKTRDIQRVAYSKELEFGQVENKICAFSDQPLNILLHQVNAVYIGYCINGQMHLPDGAIFEEEYLLQLRAFYPGGELYIWRIEDRLFFRSCNDNNNKNIGGSKENVTVYDEIRKLWGYSVKELSNGWSKLSDANRGLSLVVPFCAKKIPFVGDERKALFCKVRNYYTQDKDGMLKLIDARMFGFCDRNGNVILEVSN